MEGLFYIVTLASLVAVTAIPLRDNRSHTHNRVTDIHLATAADIHLAVNDHYMNYGRLYC